MEFWGDERADPLIQKPWFWRGLGSTEGGFWGMGLGPLTRKIRIFALDMACFGEF